MTPLQALKHHVTGAIERGESTPIVEVKDTFTFERRSCNGIAGWFATRRIDGVFAGVQFGKTRKAACAAFTKE